MTIQLTRKNHAVCFEATNQEGNSVLVDGAESVGGVSGGMRPMELALAALASCACMDLVPILEKQRQVLKDIKVAVKGDRTEGTPAPFSSITIQFFLWGDLNEAVARRAVDLSVNKYCSVGATFSDSVDITWELEINPGGAG